MKGIFEEDEQDKEGEEEHHDQLQTDGSNESFDFSTTMEAEEQAAQTPTSPPAAVDVPPKTATRISFSEQVYTRLSSISFSS